MAAKGAKGAKLDIGFLTAARGADRAAFASGGEGDGFNGPIAPAVMTPLRPALQLASPLIRGHSAKPPA